VPSGDVQAIVERSTNPARRDGARGIASGESAEQVDLRAAALRVRPQSGGAREQHRHSGCNALTRNEYSIDVTRIQRRPLVAPPALDPPVAETLRHNRHRGCSIRCSIPCSIPRSFGHPRRRRSVTATTARLRRTPRFDTPWLYGRTKSSGERRHRHAAFGFSPHWLCAYGHEGPWANRRGFDSLVRTASGFSAAEAEVSGVRKPRGARRELARGDLALLTGYWISQLGRICGMTCPDPVRRSA
jgi:hypothetical protein